MMRRWLIAAAMILAPATVMAAAYIDSDYFAGAVASEKLPPIADRLPAAPLVVQMGAGRTSGRHGGTLHTLMARSKDVRMMVVYGYARLVKYNLKFEIVPDILERIDIEDGRIFTLHLRPGHRWSDGAPFTAEDFRYYWEDVVNNPKLFPAGPPVALRAGGALPRFEVLDPLTVRYSWAAPSPKFLPALAAAGALFIYRPAHYLKRYHAAYADPAVLDEMARKHGQRGWAPLHNKLDNMYKNDNIELPTLQPWVNITKGPAERFVFVRNPYYHKVDSAGRQLPYIDRVVMQIANAKIIPAKTGTGESDLQARYLRFDNFSFLKQNEERNGFRVYLWRVAKGSHLTLYPNLNVDDPVWRRLLRDVRFRRALSLAINRHEVNQVIFYGLALPGQNTMLPDSPLFDPEFRDAWARFDLEQANRLLDEAGLDKRESDGVRLMEDGRPLEIIVESAGGTEEADVLALIRDSWAKAGIRMHIKPMSRDVARNRIYAGATVMSIWPGYENGLATPDTVPEEVAPTHQIQYQWPKWGQFADTTGKSGEAPDMAEPARLLELLGDWYKAASRSKRAAIWREMLAINADQVFTIGIVSGVMQPVVVDRQLRNVPETGLYNWDPGAHFGLYEPDSFWFADAGKG